jgi:polysaccharide pyruvyl transferase WcaK-like protein
MSLTFCISGNIYGAGNIGDDAVLFGILSLLETTFPNSRYHIGTYNATPLLGLPDQTSLFNAYDYAELRRAIQNSDVVISGGGTMLGDELGLGFPLEFNARYFSYATYYRKKRLLFSIGANQVKTAQGKILARLILNLAHLVTLRDAESLSVCKQLRPTLNAYDTADPAFILTPQESQRTKIVKDRFLSKKKVFGVNVLNEAWEKQSHYKQIIADFCSYVYTHFQYTPVFFCNEIRKDSFYDYTANKKTIEKLAPGCDYILLEPDYYSPSEMLDIISCFDFTFSLRMHGLIFSAIVGKPFLTLSRVDKVNNFMRLFDLVPSGTLEDCSLDMLISDFEIMIKEYDQQVSKIYSVVKKRQADFLKNVVPIKKLVASSYRFSFEAFYYAFMYLFKSKYIKCS